MKLWKRFGAALLALTVLTAMLTGTALAAEPEDGGISVQLDGQALAFTDAVPEITSDRTFLPFRAVLEAMGAAVDYDAETSTVSAQKDGVTLSMVPGQTELTVTEGDQISTVEMDAAPYIKESNGRTYIPVRYAAESFGYSVGWDANTRTVVLVDVDALFGDATFQLMDNFAAYSKKQGKTDNMTLSGTLNLDLDMAGNSGGMAQAVPVSAKGSLDGVSSDKGAQLNWGLDLSGLSDLLGLESLPAMEGEVRMSLESGMVYLSVPAMLTGGSADTWYSLDLNTYQDQLFSGMDMTQLTQLQTQLQDAGIREALVAVLRNLPMNDSASSYQAVTMLVDTYKAMLSDQAFTQKGNTYTAQINLEDMMDVTVTLTEKGNDIVAADIKMSCDVDEDGTKLIMTMDEYAAPDKVTVTMNMEAEVSGINVKVDLDLSCLPTTKVPVTTLPAGVQAVPLDLNLK